MRVFPRPLETITFRFVSRAAGPRASAGACAPASWKPVSSGTGSRWIAAPTWLTHGFARRPPDQIAERLGILGRLLACSSHLDMYMTSREVMIWFVQQFLEG